MFPTSNDTGSIPQKKLNSLYRTILEAVSEFPEMEVVLSIGKSLAELIAKVSSNPSYRDKARKFRKILKQTRGLDAAADIVERGGKATERLPRKR